MKKSGIILLSVLFFMAVGVVGIAMAQGNSNNSNRSNNQGNSVSNMTYGQCVVSAVGLKNSCYEISKQARIDCIGVALNDSVQERKCLTDYKAEKKQCKMDFKVAKRECVQKTKPSMFARMRYSFA